MYFVCQKIWHHQKQNDQRHGANMFFWRSGRSRYELVLTSFKYGKTSNQRKVGRRHFNQKYQQSKKWENAQYIKIPKWNETAWVRVLWLCFLGRLEYIFERYPWGGYHFITITLPQYFLTYGWSKNREFPRRFQPKGGPPQPWRCSLQPTSQKHKQVTHSNGIMFPNFRLNQQISTQKSYFKKTHQPTTKNKQNTEPQPKVHPQKTLLLLLPVSLLFSWSFSSPPLLLAFRSRPAASPQPPSAASPAAATIRRASAGGRRGPWRRPRCEDEELQRPPKCWSREGGRPVKVWRYIPLFLNYSTSLAKLFVCYLFS